MVMLTVWYLKLWNSANLMNQDAADQSAQDTYETMDVDTVIVALGTGPNPIIQKSCEADKIDINCDRKGYIVINEKAKPL